MTVATGTARVVARFVNISLKCPSGAVGACDGTLTLTASKKLVGKGDFFIDKGQTDPVQIQVVIGAWTTLKRTKTLRVAANVTGRDGDGVALKGSRAVTLTTRAIAPAPPRLVTVRSSSTRMDGRFVGVRVACGLIAKGACDGALTLDAVVARKRTRLGRGAFVTDRGKSSVVIVPLTSAARALLRRVGSVRATARATARDEAGKRGAHSRRIVVRR